MNHNEEIKMNQNNSSIEDYNNQIVCYTVDGVPITRGQLAYFHRLLREALIIVHS